MSENMSKCLDRLRSEIQATLPVCATGNNSGLYSLTTRLHLDHIPVIPQLPPPFLILGRPDHNHYRIGLGKALQLETKGSNRFQQLQSCFEKLTASWQHDCLTESPYQPGAFCAFAFDEEDSMSGPWQGIANSLIMIPEVLLEFSEGHYTLTLSCQNSGLQTRQAQIEAWLSYTTTLLTALTDTQPDNEGENSLYRAPSEPANSDWITLVKRATTAIHNKQLDKVVPARHVHIRTTPAFNKTAILKRLAENFPSCLLLGISLGDKVLVAAAPERLVSLHNGTISCDALAGTGKRSGDPRQDNLLAHGLLQDAKTRYEHQLVVDHLSQSLSSVSAHVSTPDGPSVLPLGQLQHLWTPIKAQCRPGVSLFDLVSSLHPTPAVAGTPATEAQHWIKENESFQRGWYSGGIGWIQADGNGELAVLLRAALVSDDCADLYAGAGIVADSDPKAELEETELKLGAVINTLSKEPTTEEEQQMIQQ